MEWSAFPGIVLLSLRLVSLSKRGANREWLASVRHVAYQAIPLRPVSSRNTTMMTATANRTWMNPPKVFEVTNPKNHKPSRITKIVHNILIVL